MEADLARFYGVDVRDRWRRLPDGSRALTLRMIAVRLEHLPPESALAGKVRGGEPHWALEHVLLAHNWQAVTRSKQPHPMMARAARKAARRQVVTPEREGRLREARARARARRRRLREEG